MCLVLVFFTTCKKIYFFGNIKNKSVFFVFSLFLFTFLFYKNVLGLFFIKKETKRLNILGLVLLFYKKVCYTRENAFENLDFVKM